MRYVVLVSGALSAWSPTLAHAAAAVYPGCAVPTLKSVHHTFYVDPQNGSSRGDGSAAKPWRTLAEVLNFPSKLVATKAYKGAIGNSPLVDLNPNGPIKAGDVILLKSGNHGNVNVASGFNTDFITVTAAPGQTPILTTLRFQGNQKWLFQGLKFVSNTDNSTTAIVTFPGNSNNLILDDSTVETVEDTSKWSDSDWLSKPKATGVLLYGSCMSVTNSHILNVVNGFGINSTQTLVLGNTIDNMLNDGMDVASSNVTIRSNTIQDGVQLSQSGLHADGIQGWSTTENGVVQTNSNVVIDSNVLKKTGQATNSYMQGISIFDGKWDKLTVTNNSVAVNAVNGLVIAAPSNSTIINNTVLATDPATHGRLSIGAGKDKTPAKNTIIRNNITQELYAVGDGLAVDHNIAQYLITMTNGQIKSGSIGNKNTVMPTITAGFVSDDSKTKSFDFRLKPGSPAIGAGDAANAPALDITGKKRTAPIDSGAYEH